MTTHDEHDDVRRMLGALVTLDVAPARAERIRQRAHDGLERLHPRQAASRPRVASWLARLEPAIVASVSVAFLAEVVRRAVWLSAQ